MEIVLLIVIGAIILHYGLKYKGTGNNYPMPEDEGLFTDKRPGILDNLKGKLGVGRSRNPVNESTRKRIAKRNNILGLIAISILLIHILAVNLLISFVSYILGYDGYITSGTTVVSFILGLVYFIPSFIGISRNNAYAIFAVNLFFGWSIVGYIGALIWACIPDKVNTGNIAYELDKLHELKQRGIITESEYEAEKRKLLGR